MCMLACIHPGAGHSGETNAVLDYAKTTATIVRTVTRSEVKDVRTQDQMAVDVKNTGVDP
eukprot:5679139-Prymnesium_polylepis.1